MELSLPYSKIWGNSVAICSLPRLQRRISEAIFITAGSVHDLTKREEQNSVCSGKSEAELALDVVYYSD